MHKFFLIIDGFAMASYSEHSVHACAWLCVDDLIDGMHKELFILC